MKTTPTLGLKLYDGTDAPDLVSGYNASMEKLDGSRILCFKRPLVETDDLNDLKDTGYYNDAANAIPANAAPGLTRPVRYITLDACTSPGTGQCTTQIAVGTPVVGKDNMLIRNYHANTGWTEWLPVSAEQGALPANGAAGQVLVKSSASDYDCEWMDPAALDTIHEIKTGPGLTAWLKAFPSTGEWWSGPGEVTITANGSTQQYTGNWTVHRTPSIGNAYFQGSEGRAATAHFASLKTDHNANVWAFVMSIKDTEPLFQYVGEITTQLTAMLKRVTTFDAS